jgi:hypothetical protein
LFNHQVISPEGNDNGEEGAPKAFGDYDTRNPRHKEYQLNQAFHIISITPLAESKSAVQSLSTSL